YGRSRRSSPRASRRRRAALRARSPEAPLNDPASVLEEARRELARLPNLLEGMVGDLDDATARARPAPGEWAAVEILCHLRDEEAEDFGARLRVILDGRKEFAPIEIGRAHV